MRARPVFRAFPNPQLDSMKPTSAIASKGLSRDSALQLTLFPRVPSLDAAVDGTGARVPGHVEFPANTQSQCFLHRPHLSYDQIGAPILPTTLIPCQCPPRGRNLFV